MNNKISILDEIVRHEVLRLLNEYNISLEEIVSCTYKPGEELALPSNDYALMRGREVLLTCHFRGVEGQVFTVMPRFFHGSIGAILRLSLDSIEKRSVFYATINALLRYMGLIDRTIHCRGYDPEKCGERLARWIINNYGYGIRVLHIGYQPGHVRILRRFLKDDLIVTDLSSELVGKRLFNDLLVIDGLLNKVLIGYVDVVLATSSSAVNTTFYDILLYSILLNKDLVVYGISGTGLISLLKRYSFGSRIKFFCPYSS